MSELTFDQFIQGEKPKKAPPKRRKKPPVPVTSKMELWRIAGHAARDAIITNDPDQCLFGWVSISSHVGLDLSTVRKYYRLFGLPVAIIVNRRKRGPKYFTTKSALNDWLRGYHILTREWGLS